jgi:hypothetical protein
MATLKLIQNGKTAVANPRKRKTRKRRRRNPTALASVENAKRKRRRSTRRRRNPVALSTVPNARRRRKTVRRRRRNGTLLAKNGFFGDTKETTRSVIALLLGLGVTKVESQILAPQVARLLATVGLQNFATPITEVAVSVTINKWVAEQLGTRNDGKFVMIGGLAMAAMHAIEQFLPGTSVYNPFARVNATPIVMNQPNVIDAKTAKALVNAASMETAAKVAGALDSIGGGTFAPRSNRGVASPRF